MTSEKKTLTRRQLFRRGLAGGVIVGLGGIFAYQSSGYHLADAITKDLQVLSAKEYLVFQAAARRILRADEADAPSIEEVGVVKFVDGYLARQPSWVASDVSLLLNALEHTSPLLDFTFSRFTRQNPEQQDATLKAWGGSRLDMRKQGYQALRGLCFVAYYRHPSSWGLMGYDGPLVKKKR